MMAETSEESIETSLEFLVARATDHFSSRDAEQRQAYVEKICERLETDFDGPYVVLRLLSHRMLSPDQVEALNALEALDAVVRRGGLRVANECGKFKFLNQFIRLLSPKHQGLQTSERVREKVICLLFCWKSSWPQSDKLERVYNLLKEQGIVEADPVSQIPKLSIRDNKRVVRSSRSSAEDEERARLLTRLLHSKRPEDLQAANRMIKALVKMEDRKQEQEQKLRETIDISRTKRALLHDLLIAHEEEPQFSDRPLMQELFDYLLDVRPTLFHYAAEAADRQDEVLGEILALNDTLNSTIQRYKDLFEGPLADGSAVRVTKNEIRLLPDLDDEDDEQTADHVHFDPLAKPGDGSRTGIQRKPTPHSKVGGAFASDHFDLLATQSGQQLTVDRPGPSGGSISDDLESLLLNEPQKPAVLVASTAKAKNEDHFLLNDVKIGLRDVEFPPFDPIVFCDQQHVKGLLHYAKSNKTEGVMVSVATVTLTHPRPLNGVRLHFSSKSPLIAFRNVDEREHQFTAFNPLDPVHKLTQLFLVLPLTQDVHEAEIEYSLTSQEFKFESSFSLDLKR
ncbi:ADP-ribosylation factor-binding protein GGA1 [Aphelenchoides fujianensis]|nr:ADP-ribosylation factor-binding protein GGA1 [Aphelenchoides fujianensis]